MRHPWNAALAAVVLAIVAFLASLAAEPDRESGAPQIAVIPAGQEARVMELLAPLLADGFVGLRVDGVQVERDAIRVQLRADRDTPAPPGCELPAWVRSPGAITVTYQPVERTPSPAERHRVSQRPLVLSWALCPPLEGARVEEAARDLVGAMAARLPNDLWTISEASSATRSAGSPSASAVTSHASSGSSEPEAIGILTPAVDVIGLRPPIVAALLVLLAALVSAIVAAWLARETIPDPDHRADGASPRLARSARASTYVVAALVVAAGTAGRLWAAAHLDVDIDERWAFPPPRPVLVGDHDAWVHPPLFRAIQQGWVIASGWHDGDPLWVLRAPSWIAAVLALAFAATALSRSRAARWAPAALTIVALAPLVVSESVLARPYAMATLWVVLVMIALWADADESGVRGRRWFVAITAAGLAAWTDLVAGLVAAAFIVARLAARDALPIGIATRGRAAILAAVLTWVVGLAPGAWRAAHEFRTIDPTAPSAAEHEVPSSEPATVEHRPGLDLRPGHGLGSGGGAIEFGVAALTFAMSGQDRGQIAFLAGTVALVVLLYQSRRRGLATLGGAVVLAVALAIALSAVVSLRPRNVLFLPHVWWLAIGLVLAARRPPGNTPPAGTPAVQAPTR